MTTRNMEQSNKNLGKNEEKFEIQIDRTHFRVTRPSLSGQELRQLPTPPICPERDLFQVVPGGSDQKIADVQSVEMSNGLRFFTAPGQINPGGVIL
jgi:hypothetical protein